MIRELRATIAIEIANHCSDGGAQAYAAQGRHTRFYTHIVRGAGAEKPYVRVELESGKDGPFLSFGLDPAEFGYESPRDLVWAVRRHLGREEDSAGQLLQGVNPVSNYLHTRFAKDHESPL